ncbi:MAG: class II aldolase/adducin family protein [Chloroflexi bacterium]|nr:class II aldolase/adducin family protein [Chloroflexota bacterium]
MNPTDATESKEACCRVGRELAEHGWAPGSSGNISARLNAETFWITPSGKALGTVKPAELCEISILPTRQPEQTSDCRPSSELPMHRVVYENLPDVHAVIHAHLPYTIALSLHDFDFQRVIVPESVLTLGTIGVAPYSLPASEENAVAVSQLMMKHHTIVLPRHGALTFGEQLEQALHRLETLESLAQTIHLALQLGEVQDLPEAECRRLWEHRQKF